MSAAHPQTRLRLVGSPDPIAPRPRASSTLVLAPSVRVQGRVAPAAEALQRDAVARENALAARMSALDVRWVLAVQAYRSLEGGKAAIIRPDARARLLALGERVGLRPFDANLVIAIVQDAARTGDDPLGPFAVDRLHLVPSPEQRTHCAPEKFSARVLWTAASTALLAGVIAFALARWLIG